MNSANSSRRPFWVAMTVASAALLAHLAARHFGWSLLPDAWGSLELATGNAGLLAIWAIGHCDGMDGPVVTLARKALESGNVNLILPWVAEQDEEHSGMRWRCASWGRKRRPWRIGTFSKRWCASIVPARANPSPG